MKLIGNVQLQKKFSLGFIIEHEEIFVDHFIVSKAPARKISRRGSFCLFLIKTIVKMHQYKNISMELYFL